MTIERPSEPLLPFHLFDDEADVAAVQRKLPHWSQPGTVAFITWRTLDSMPVAVVKQVPSWLAFVNHCEIHSSEFREIQSKSLADKYVTHAEATATRR